MVIRHSVESLAVVVVGGLDSDCVVADGIKWFVVVEDIVEAGVGVAGGVELERQANLFAGWRGDNVVLRHMARIEDITA